VIPQEGEFFRSAEVKLKFYRAGFKPKSQKRASAGWRAGSKKR